MNETSRPEGGPPRPLLTVHVLRDTLARVVRIREALQDGDHLFAEDVAGDLAADLWRLVEAAERRQ